MIPVATVWGKCSNIFGSLTVWAVQKQLMPCLALLKTRRLFYLQAIASSVHKKGEESAGLSLLFTARIRHSSVCEDEDSVLNVQEKENAQWL